MDVLRPQLMYIGGRCYRKNPLQNSSMSEKERSDFDDEYMEPIEDATYEDETCDALSPIEETDSGFRLRLPIPNAFYKHIIGAKGVTKKRIESETKTRVNIPRQGDTGDIVITGRERRGVQSAQTRIEVLIDAARQKTPFTHFISIPINSPEVLRGFDQFKREVLRECSGDEGLDETIFQIPAKLHLTIGTLALMDDTEINNAVRILEDCKSEIEERVLEGQGLEAKLERLEYMNDDPTAVDVLYAQVKPADGSTRLQQLAECLVDRFVSSGLMGREYDRVKLHVTLLNTLMRKDPTGNTEPSKRDRLDRQDRQGHHRDRNRESFNAANVLHRFGDFKFGRQPITTVHLSTRFSKGKDGYYDCAGRIQLF